MRELKVGIVGRYVAALLGRPWGPGDPGTPGRLRGQNFITAPDKIQIEVVPMWRNQRWPR